MMSAMRYSTRRRFIGVLATILLLFLIVVARGVTASDQEEAQQTSTPTPTATPERTSLPVGPAPLTLTKTVSTDTVLPGQSFTYTLHITTSRAQARVEVRDMLDGGVEVVSVESASGGCTSAGIIVCYVQVKAQEPATIMIVVRTRTTVVPDTWLVGQALAQDDHDFTAASERVAVRVAVPPPSLSAPVAAPPIAEMPLATTDRQSDRQTTPESRVASRTGAVTSLMTAPTAIPPIPAAAPPLSRAASALTGAADSGSVAPAPVDTGTQAPAVAAPGGGEHAASWLDLVTTINP